MLHVTKHLSYKMVHMVSLNTDTYTNRFCQRMSRDKRLVCSKCYAMRLASFYGKKAMARFVQNGEALSHRMLRSEEIPVLNHVLVRFHSFGELLNTTHYMNFCTIAAANPETTFALWTKRVDLVDVTVKPENMLLIYSNPWIGREIEKPIGFDKVFSVYPADADVEFNCEDQCWSCRKCYRPGEPVEITERLR